MSTAVVSLPVPLLLLVHLHILEYPLANKSEYDHNIFDRRVRSLKERTKTLEDICYFLVGLLERNPRTVLPTYPCLQPSDTIAFRTSLAKYLEALRHRLLYPASKESSGEKTAAPKDVQGWWWKDVVVRKSLLEECSGNKFECLLLSFSTHVLLNCLPSPNVRVDNILNGPAHYQPSQYAKHLAQYLSARHGWSHSVKLLLQRQDFLKSLRDHLASRGDERVSMYSSLETERLTSLVNSKRQDLLRHVWHGRSGRLALDFLSRLSGLDVRQREPDIAGTFSDTDTYLSSVIPTVTERDNPCTKITLFSQRFSPQIQSLPMAAAHHPAHLKKIRRPIFSSVGPKPHVGGSGAERTALLKPSHTTAVEALQNYHESEMRAHQALIGALGRTRKIAHDMSTRLNIIKRNQKSTPGTVTPIFWRPTHDLGQGMVDLDRRPTRELLSHLKLDAPNENMSLETRINHIRNLFPSYTNNRDLFAPRVAPSDGSTAVSNSHAQHGLSKIPRPNLNSGPSGALRKPYLTGAHASDPYANELMTSTPLQVKAVIDNVGNGSKISRDSSSVFLTIYPGVCKSVGHYRRENQPCGLHLQGRLQNYYRSRTILADE